MATVPSPPQDSKLHAVDECLSIQKDSAALHGQRAPGKVPTLRRKGSIPTKGSMKLVEFGRLALKSSVPGSKLPLFPYNRGWETQPNSRGLYTHYKDSRH